MNQYVHIMPGEEGIGLSWQYTVLEEMYLKYGDLDIIYLLAEVVSGSVCVCVGKLRYIQVPGFIISRHSGLDSKCRAVSTVAPVVSEEDRGKITGLLTERHPEMQVCFS